MIRVKIKPRGRSRRARETSKWVFASHLVLVFTATLGAMLCFSTGHMVAGGLSTAAWLILFIVTSLDNVRFPSLERAGDWVLARVAKLTQRSGGTIPPADVTPADGVDTPAITGETEEVE